MPCTKTNPAESAHRTAGKKLQRSKGSLQCSYATEALSGTHQVKHQHSSHERFLAETSHSNHPRLFHSFCKMLSCLVAFGCQLLSGLADGHHFMHDVDLSMSPNTCCVYFVWGEFFITSSLVFGGWSTSLISGFQDSHNVARPVLLQRHRAQKPGRSQECHK